VGDQIGQAVEGTLYYIPYTEFQRVRTLNLQREQRAAIFADMCRLNALYMIARAGSGHIGSSFSSLDIISWLLLEEMSEEDIFFSSKGHDAPGYYSALIGMGRLEFDLIHKLRKIDGLPGHPDVGTPEIVTNTGSLGMGISKAKGMVFANRLAKKPGRVFVMTGDGELQEGQFWESLISAVNFGLHEITVIVDHNKLQSDTFVKNVSDLGDLEAKLNAFGWCVRRCDGNDIGALSATLASLKGEKRPQIIVADTIKGKGVSFMEHTSLDSDVAMYRFHSGAPDADSYRLAAQEILSRLKQRLIEAGQDDLSYEIIEREGSLQPPASAQRLMPAYTRALLDQAKKNQNLVALDADLILDTGLIPFREEFPQRFFECGIAEQDMVSIAGGMALRGLLPVVHSFACFLSARPNEQIYNNATERTKIIYVGSLAGVVPGGTGHSHQAIRDISTLSSIPGLVLIEPSNESEVSLALAWAINMNTGSTYIRLNPLPYTLNFELPKNHSLSVGQGAVLHDGQDVVIFGYGLMLLNLAMSVQTEAVQNKVSVKVVSLPWLNRIDINWLLDVTKKIKHVVLLDNHYENGGQGTLVASVLAGRLPSHVMVTQIGVKEIPPSGTNEEVLKHLGIDKDNILKTILTDR
jgi:transketolase